MPCSLRVLHSTALVCLSLFLASTASAAEVIEGKDAPPLHQAFSELFPVGAAIEPYQLKGDQATLLKRHFNSITAENAMKPENMQPREGSFNFDKADELVEFATKNGIKMRGHTLVWHSQTPQWFFTGPDGKQASKDLLIARMKTHIQTIVSRYKGKIYAWDVVNEAIIPADPNGWRKESQWYQILGEDFMDYAFRFAHEADPQAKLFYNDYDTTDPKKRTLIAELIKRMQARGVPIHGLGHQMHITINSPRAGEIAETLDSFAKLGIDQQVTELDMTLYANQSDDSFDSISPELITRQAFRYKEVFDVFRARKAQITGVTFWSMADDHTWLSTWPKPRLEKPLLFDNNLRPKEAFWAVTGDASRMPIAKKQQISLVATPNMTLANDASWNTPAAIQSKLAKGDGFTLATAWTDDDDKMFVRIDVKDKSVTKDSAVHLFIDPDNSKSERYTSKHKHLVLYNDGRAAPGADYKVFATADGYRILATLEVVTKMGKAIGFDARVTASDGSVSAWNDSKLNQDTSPANWGSLLLAPSVKIANAKKGTPVIDGTVDDAWADAPEIETNIKVEGNGAGARAKIKLMWDESNTLYLLYTVTDAKLGKKNENPWEQDSVEVFIDENNARAPAYDSDDAQFRVNYVNVQTFAGNANAKRIRSATKEIPGGYLVEAAIKMDTITLQPGAIIGFDAQINDDLGTGSRGSVQMWNDGSGNTWQSMGKAGLLGFNP
jgi:endo-1,4-beta-xylanase